MRLTPAATASIAADIGIIIAFEITKHIISGRGRGLHLSEPISVIALLREIIAEMLLRRRDISDAIKSVDLAAQSNIIFKVSKLIYFQL